MDGAWGQDGGQEATRGRSREVDEPQNQRGLRGPSQKPVCKESPAACFFHLARLEGCPCQDMKTHLCL